MKRSTQELVAGLLVLFFVFGCGKDNSDRDASPPGATGDEWLSPDMETKSPAGPAGLKMRIRLVANGVGGTLAPGEVGWCVLSFRNISKEAIRFPTLMFSGEADYKRTPSAVRYMSYRGIGVATLAARWSNDHTTGKWQRLAPPDSPVALAPNPDEMSYFARLIKAPKNPGIYQLTVRLDTIDAARAMRTRGLRDLRLLEKPVCLEATIQVKIATDVPPDMSKEPSPSDF